MRRVECAKIGLIGLGAIGRPVALALAAGSLPGLGLAGILTRTQPDGFGEHWVKSLPELLNQSPALIVEAAGGEAFSELVPECLSAGIDVIAVSIAAMAQPEVEERVNKAMAQGGGRLHVASGAIGGLDAIRAALELGLDSVELIQRKPLSAFSDQTLDADKAHVMSSGSAREAAIAFPRNSNIAAAVAMAGIGFDKTVVTVMADPAVTSNQAELKVQGAFGRLSLTIENRPSAENPRTAALAGQSVLAALRKMRADIIVPA